MSKYNLCLHCITHLATLAIWRRRPFVGMRRYFSMARDGALFASEIILRWIKIQLCTSLAERLPSGSSKVRGRKTSRRHLGQRSIAESLSSPPTTRCGHWWSLKTKCEIKCPRPHSPTETFVNWKSGEGIWRGESINRCVSAFPFFWCHPGACLLTVRENVSGSTFKSRLYQTHFFVFKGCSVNF